MSFRMVCLAVFLFFSGTGSPAWALSLDGLTDPEKALRQSTLQAMVPFVDQRKKEGMAPLITWQELYQRLSSIQKAFLDEFRAIDPVQLGGSSRRLPPPSPSQRFIRIDRQVVLRNGKPIRMDAQVLPVEAYEAYRRMMSAMEADLGRRLLVESGYRSPAYQLYLFLFYMPNHAFSVRETNRHVALPGCSEHGSPAFQAMDFITPEGVNGEDRPEEFEELQEYGWLHARAREFGFHLSYPRGGDSAFEPWHWHWEETQTE